MSWSVLKIRILPSVPEQGVLVARVLAFGQYETGELAHRAMALGYVPAVERGLVILVRTGELRLRPEHAGSEGKPPGALRPPLIDWRAGGCRPLLPDLSPAEGPPAWAPPALDHLADLFLQPPAEIGKLIAGSPVASLLIPPAA